MIHIYRSPALYRLLTLCIPLSDRVMLCRILSTPVSDVLSELPEAPVDRMGSKGSWSRAPHRPLPAAASQSSARLPIHVPQLHLRLWERGECPAPAQCPRGYSAARQNSPRPLPAKLSGLSSLIFLTVSGLSQGWAKTSSKPYTW